MLRLGIVDFDSSHSIEFTRRFNHVGVSADQRVEGARVVVGCPGRSTMAPERIELFRPQIADCGVELVNAPEGLLGRVDAVLILSLCGGAHLAHARLLIENGVPVFVDKPLACSVEDAAEIRRLSVEHGVLAWSASGMRFSDDIHILKSRSAVVGPLHGVVSHGPGWLNAGNPGLLHYGIHVVEQAYAAIGPGCIEVSCRSNEHEEEVTGRWRDGRIVTVRTLRRGATAYGLLTFHELGILHTPVSAKNSYRNLCSTIVEAFTSGSAPVALDETLEVIQFIRAARNSEQSDGKPVPLIPPPIPLP